MVDPIWAAGEGASAAAVASAEAVWRVLKTDLARRKIKAGGSFKLDLIGGLLDEALDLLAQKKDALLKRPVAKLRNLISNPPPEFSSPYVQDWINDTRTRTILKKAVLSAFDDIEDLELERSAVELYEKITLDEGLKAKSLFYYTLRFLAETINVQLSTGDRLIIDTIRRSDAENKELLTDIKDLHAGSHVAIKELDAKLEDIRNVTAERIPQDAVDQFLRQRLSIALKRRSFREAKAEVELVTIAERALDGNNLSGASTGLRTHLFRESAAALARDGQIIDARAWLNRAKDLSPSVNLQTDEARICINEGNPTEALRMLRDIDTPEARSMMLDALGKESGIDAAINLFTEKYNDPTRLSPLGLLSLASNARKVNQYDFAEKILARASEDQIAQCPAILSLRASTRVALCLPEKNRQLFDDIIAFNPRNITLNDAPEKIRLRVSALSDAERFLKATTDLGLTLFRESVEELVLWLKLVSPEKDKHDEALKELSEYAKEPKQAVRYLRFIADYDVECNFQSLEAYLQTRKVLGGWGPGEALAALMLAVGAGNSERLILLIRDNRPVFDGIVDPAFLLGLEIEAIANTGDTTRALELVAENTEVLGADTSRTLSNIIREKAGEDALPLRRSSFEKSKNEVDRRLFIEALLSNKHYSEAAEHLEQLFLLVPNIGDAIQVCQCYVSDFDHAKLRSFLAHPDVSPLVSTSADLQAFVAWSLYFSGNLGEARRKLDRLLQSRENRSDLALLVNICIEMGQWEDLHLFLSKELDRKDRLSSVDLIRALGISRVIRYPRIEEFIDAAGSKGLEENDPQLLLEAYSTLHSIGIEERKARASDWLSKAIELSDKDGPVRSYDMREVVEFVAKQQEANTQVNELVTKGDAPLAIAALPLRTSLSDIVAGNLERSIRNSRVLHRAGLPLYAGSRLVKELGDRKCIALDRTSLLTLGFLGLLEAVLSSFDRVIIARSAMSEFFADLERVRHHQPSRVEAAQRLINKVASSELKSLAGADIDGGFGSGLDDELRELLHAAEQTGGIALVSPPIYRTGSYLEETVDMAPYMHLVCGAQELVDYLVDEGKISLDNASRARSDLLDGGRRWEKCARPRPDKPLYVDRLALDRIFRAGLFPTIRRLVSEVYVNHSTIEYAKALVENTDEQAAVEASVQNVRKSVLAAIWASKVWISPILRSQTNERDRTSLENLIVDPGDAELIVVDDRAVNKFEIVTKQNGSSVPVFSTIDLLNWLCRQHMITNVDLRRAHEKLRKGGALFVPISNTELADASLMGNPLRSASFELSAISEYIDFVRYRAVLELPQEENWLFQVNLAILGAIREIWKRASSSEIAIVASSRLLETMPISSEWSRPSSLDAGDQWAKRIDVLGLAFLANGSDFVSTGRFDAYMNWFERYVVDPTSQRDPSIVAAAAERICDTLLGSLDEIVDGYTRK